MPGRRLLDYGGRNSEKRSYSSKKIAPEDCISARCISCNKLHYVAKQEMARVGRTRCTACGGGLMELEESHYRRLGVTKAQVKKQKNLNEAQKPFKCKHCTAAFRNEAALALHTREKHGDSKERKQNAIS